MLDVKKVEHLYGNSYLSYLASAAGSVLVFWLLNDIAPPTYLTAWFVIFIVLTVVRLALSYAFQKTEHITNVDVWLIAFCSMSFISGTLWGVSGFILIPQSGIALLESVMYHGMLLLFIAVLIAGSVITYSISRIVFLSFSFPAVVPQCLMLIAKGDVYHSFLGGFMLAYALVVFVISVYMNRLLTAAVKSQAENEMLRELVELAGIEKDKLKSGR